METRIALWGIGATLLGSLIVGATYLDQRSREDAQAVPRIHFVAAREENEFAYVTLNNTSPKTFANVHGVVFRITDEATLKAIAKVYPAPVLLPAHKCDPNMKCEASADVDDVFFRRGYWDGDSYVYRAQVALNLPTSGEASDLRLAVIDRSLQKALGGTRLIGRLEIQYDRGMSTTADDWGINNVRVPVRAND
jgi:hypothetical protein